MKSGLSTVCHVLKNLTGKIDLSSNFLRQHSLIRLNEPGTKDRHVTTTFFPSFLSFKTNDICIIKKSKPKKGRGWVLSLHH